MSPGTRVAVVSADRKKFLGYGAYLGDFYCLKLAAVLSKTARDKGNDELADWIMSEQMGPARNPKIELDDGNVVWGCECWWGPEDKFKKNGYAEKYKANQV